MRILIVFFMKMLELFISEGIQNKRQRQYNYQNNFRKLNGVEKVLALEKRRQIKGYKPQWLYYRCKEEGLLSEYNDLFKGDTKKIASTDYSKDTRIKMPFGKYKGKPVDEVWGADKSYLKYIMNQGWLENHKDVEMYIEGLIFNE